MKIVKIDSINTTEVPGENLESEVSDVSSAKPFTPPILDSLITPVEPLESTGAKSDESWQITNSHPIQSSNNLEYFKAPDSNSNSVKKEEQETGSSIAGAHIQLPGNSVFFRGPILDVSRGEKESKESDVNAGLNNSNLQRRKSY